MTDASVKGKPPALKIIRFILLFLLLLLLLIYAREVKEGVIYGMGISFTTVIPTLFPFFILSDLLVTDVEVNHTGIVQKYLARIMHISQKLVPSVALGYLCGFPLGVMAAAGYYKEGMIDEGEMDSAIFLGTNPSAAFVISGIGTGIYGSVSIGIILYFSVIISSAIVGRFSNQTSSISRKPGVILRQRFSLVDSISSAGRTSISVASYIIFFSALISLLSAMVRSELATGVFSMLLEISCASLMIAKSSVTLEAKYVLTAFSLGFSGMSMQMQAMAMAHAKINRSRLIIKKALQGILAAAITLVMIKIKEALHI